MKECPSCGYAVDDNMGFCPVCGSKMNNANSTKKTINIAFENDLARADAYASCALYTKSKIICKECNAGEVNYLNLIDRYPSEPKVYIAYVNYMTKYLERVMNPNKGDDSIYFNDINGLIERCRIFLNNATKYNTDNDYEVIQEISRLQGCLESLKMNQPEINTKNNNNKKAAIWGIVAFVFIIFFLIIGNI